MIILFIAQSLDGFVASEDGRIDWLPQTMAEKFQKFYKIFYNNIDTIFMGRCTYEQITRDLSPNKWPYPNTITYVWTSDPHLFQEEEHIKFINEDIVSFSKSCKEKSNKNIWLLGGAKLIQEFIHKDLIDEYIITYIPVLVGEGKSLFSSLTKDRSLMIHDILYNKDMAQITYRRRKNITI